MKAFCKFCGELVDVPAEYYWVLDLSQCVCELCKHYLYDSEGEYYNIEDVKNGSRSAN